jgi:hypothetical protein
MNDANQITERLSCEIGESLIGVPDRDLIQFQQQEEM